MAFYVVYQDRAPALPGVFWCSSSTSRDENGIAELHEICSLEQFGNSCAILGPQQIGILLLYGIVL